MLRWRSGALHRWVIGALYTGCSLQPNPMAAQSAPTLEGAWRVVERSYERGDSSWVVESPQPGLYLFTGTRYSVQEIRESGPRPSFTDDTSSSDRLAAFDVFHAHAGSYVVAGDQLRVTPIIAMSPNTMDGATHTYGLVWAGSEIQITRSAADEVRTTRLRRIE